MDTRSKKFNSTLVVKIIAFMLCLTCVLNCASQAIKVYNSIEDYNIREYTARDAVERVINPKETIHTRTFKRHFVNYTGLIATMTGNFGNGTEEDYDMWKNSLSASNEAYFQKARENLINHIIADEFLLYLKLIQEGVVTPLGILTTAEYNGYSTNIATQDIEEYGISYHELCNTSSGNVVKFTNDKDVQKKAEKLGADGVFELNKYYQIIDGYEDWDYEEEIAKNRILESYKPSFYAFKINDSVLKEKMTEHNVFRSDNYGSAAAFVKAYKEYADTVDEEYPSGRYFIRDNSGRVYTNMEKLSVSSSEKDIKAAFDKLGFWCYDSSGSGDFDLPDRSYYTYSNAFSPYSARYGEEDYDFVVTTTMMPVVPSRTETTMVNGEAVTQPASKPQVDTNDSTPFVDESGGNSWTCIFGVDMNGEYPQTDLFRTAESQITVAALVLEDVFMTAGIFGTLFLVCFIYLIVRAGRRSGDKEIHLLKTDNMFVDWRIVLDCLAGFGLFMLFVLAVDSFGDNYELEVFSVIVSVLTAAFTAVVIDLVLFITRHIKAKTILNRLFPVWLIGKALGYCKNKISPVISEKLLYTKEFAKGTLVRIGIVTAVNLVAGFFGMIECTDNGTFLIFALLVLFDLAVLAWVIRFVGGLHKIFSCLEQIRQGNYDVYVNTYALPATLRESAEKVMSLRDGLKSAVDEAVRQEQTKTELITNVSHDLKTPLTSIINYVDLLKKCEISDSDAKEYLDVLGEKSDRLKKLIEDLVEASKASTGNIKVEVVEVSLNEMVSQLLGEHADGLEKRKLSVVAEMPETDLTVKADGKLLYRVMENLIVNVEKYSLYGTRVYVTVREENGYGTVTFKNISERPLNITADQLKERFVRGDESRSTEGNGLGLSIAESLCNVQGGELEISINGDLFTAKVKLKK